METLKERLIEFINYKEMSRRAFLLSCGFSESYLNNISKGISYDAIEKIKNKYPELSMPWLILGEGEMIKGESVQKIHNPPYPEAINENIVVPLFDIEAAANLAKIMTKENENIIGLSLSAININNQSFVKLVHENAHNMRSNMIFCLEFYF
jgi:hypothetical protein